MSTSKAFKNGYDRYSSYDKKTILREYDEILLKENKVFSSLLEKYGRSLKKKHPRFIEIGCGSAKASVFMAKTFPNADVYALDVLPESIIAAKKTAAALKCGKNLKFIKADALKMPYKGGYFDIVFSQGTIEHFKDPSKIMNEQLRVLDKDGFLVINVPQKFSYYTIKKRVAILRKKWEPGWETEYSYFGMKKLAKKFSLNLVEVKGQTYDSKITEIVKAYDFFSKLLPKSVDTFLRKDWNKFKDRKGHLFLVEIIGVFKKISTKS